MIAFENIQQNPQFEERKLNCYFGAKVIHEQELPWGYIRLNFLQSTSVQILDTEYISQTGIHSFECEFAITQNTTGASLFAARTNTGITPAPSRIGNWYFNAQNRPSLYIGTSSNLLPISAANALIVNNKYKVNLSVTQPTITMFLNDVSLGSASFSGTSRTLQPLHLFGAVAENNLQEFISAKMYSFKIWDGAAGTLVRNFIPALDKANKPCLYCTVTKKPYYNIRPTGNDFQYG